MPTDGQNVDVDASLVPYLHASNGEADMLLARLVSESADPTVRGILKSKLHVSLDPADGRQENQDALEIMSEVRVQLLMGLRRLKTDSQRGIIANFRGYVAVVTYHACYQHLRQKHPDRWRLKNRLRYLLTHRSGFGLWQDQTQEWLCGISKWRDHGPVACSKLDELSKSIPWFTADKTDVSESDPAGLTALLNTVFEHTGGPVRLEDLVSFVGKLCGVTRSAQKQTGPGEPLASQADFQVDVAAITEQRIHLERLWTEVSELPLRHRAALLLNLRDAQGRGVIHLFPLTHVATIRQLANTLGFNIDDFARVWHELPWDDATIAARLGLTRQQVINLRHSARARLARRVKGF